MQQTMEQNVRLPGLFLLQRQTLATFSLAPEVTTITNHKTKVQNLHLSISIPLSGPTGHCPFSYIYAGGDVPGYGIGNGIFSVENISSCAGHCAANSNCCSFEYSPSKKNCNLNTECQPTTEVHEDYNFCVKGNLIPTSVVTQIKTPHKSH